MHFQRYFKFFKILFLIFSRRPNEGAQFPARQVPGDAEMRRVRGGARPDHQRGLLSDLLLPFARSQVPADWHQGEDDRGDRQEQPHFGQGRQMAKEGVDFPLACLHLRPTRALLLQRG